MSKTGVAKHSMAKFFQQGLEWLAASSLGSVIYFAIMWELQRLLVSVAVAFALLLLVVLRHFRIRDKSNAPISNRISQRSSRAAYLAANALTFLRPGIGIAAGLVMSGGNVTLGFSLFLVGTTTDVLDGMIARMYQVQSAHGREWDAIADVIHNFSFGLGIAWLAVGPPVDKPRGIVLCAVVVMFVVSRFIVEVHSVVDKVLSGLWRVVLFVLAYSLLPQEWRLAGLFGGGVLAAIGGIYELGVIRNEIQGGTRKWI